MSLSERGLWRPLRSPGIRSQTEPAHSTSRWIQSPGTEETTVISHELLDDARPARAFSSVVAHFPPNERSAAQSAGIALLQLLHCFHCSLTSVHLQAVNSQSPRHWSSLHSLLDILYRKWWHKNLSFFSLSVNFWTCNYGWVIKQNQIELKCSYQAGLQLIIHTLSIKLIVIFQLIDSSQVRWYLRLYASVSQSSRSKYFLFELMLKRSVNQPISHFICWSQLLRCEDLLLFFVLYHWKYNILKYLDIKYNFRTVGQTEKFEDINLSSEKLWGPFLTFTDIQIKI